MNYDITCPALAETLQSLVVFFHSVDNGFLR